jgi:chorismate mutase-like protein
VSVRQIAGRFLVAAMMATVVLPIAGAAQADAATVGDGSAAGGVSAATGSLGRLGPLTDLVIQRLFVSDEVAAAKFGTTKPIDDPAREQQELTEVRESAESLGIDPAATVSFFQQQITASKVVQRGLFDRWTAHPDQAPTTQPDLTVIRGELDQITTGLLAQLVAQRHLLSGGLQCRVRLDVATASGVVFDHLDALHRHALAVALASTCTN